MTVPALDVIQGLTEGRMRNGWITLMVLAFTLGGCATAGERTQRTGSRDLLTAAEIQERGTAVETAYEAVQQLRPHFMRERSNPTMGVGAARVDPVRVYVNGVQRGGVQELERIRIEEVVSIRYVRPTDAQTRYGMDHGSGAIEVTIHGGS